MSVLERYADVLERLPANVRDVVERKLQSGWTLWRVRVGETIELTRGESSSSIAWLRKDFWVISGNPTVEFQRTSRWSAGTAGGCFNYYRVTFNAIGDIVAYEVHDGLSLEFQHTKRLYVCVQD